jgi:hypothetical protein
LLQLASFKPSQPYRLRAGTTRLASDKPIRDQVRAIGRSYGVQAECLLRYDNLVALGHPPEFAAEYAILEWITDD